MVQVLVFDVIQVIDIVIDFFRMRNFTGIGFNELIDDRGRGEYFPVNYSKPDKKEVDVKFFPYSLMYRLRSINPESG